MVLHASLMLSLLTGKAVPNSPIPIPLVRNCSESLWSHARREESRAVSPDRLDFMLRDYDVATLLVRVPGGKLSSFKRAIVDDAKFVLPPGLVRARDGVLTAVAYGDKDQLARLNDFLGGVPAYAGYTFEIVDGKHHERTLDLSLASGPVSAEIASPKALANLIALFPSDGLMIEDTLNDESFAVLAQSRLADIPSELFARLGIRRYRQTLAKQRDIPQPGAAWMIPDGSRWILSVPAFQKLTALATLDAARDASLDDQASLIVARQIEEAIAEARPRDREPVPTDLQTADEVVEYLNGRFGEKHPAEGNGSMNIWMDSMYEIYKPGALRRLRAKVMDARTATEPGKAWDKSRERVMAVWTEFMDQPVTRE